MNKTQRRLRVGQYDQREPRDAFRMGIEVISQDKDQSFSCWDIDNGRGFIGILLQKGLEFFKTSSTPPSSWKDFPMYQDHLLSPIARIGINFCYQNFFNSLSSTDHFRFTHPYLQYHTHGVSSRRKSTNERSFFYSLFIKSAIQRYYFEIKNPVLLAQGS